ncbi:MAG: DUF3048 domain-containing protein [Actinobacteria bacterium]|nr:DUF3048 domain-containing protein [Actinomycetota bacterium]
MFFKKFVISLIGVGSVVIVGLSIISPDQFSKLGEIENVFKDPEPVNSLSGRIGIDGPILVVKIDDTRAAHPQAGLEDADVVYIEQVEGGLTRIAAVFSSKIPAVIGPVRSARISDIEILEQFGRVAFAYSGAQKKLLTVIAAANLENLGAQRQSREIYSNDPLRSAPTAMMLQAQALMQKVKEQQLPVAISKSAGWNFAESFDTGTAIVSAKVSWPANSYDAVWSSTEKRWLLSHSGVANLAANGTHLGASTFVIQIVSITPSEYGDKFGGVTPFTATVGSGRGYILRDGKYIAALWERATPDVGTSWKTTSGEEIPFAAGQIWIALTDKEPVFTPIPSKSPADAPSATAK